MLDLAAVASRPREIKKVEVEGDVVYLRSLSAGDVIKAQSTYPREVTLAMLALSISNESGELIHPLTDDTLDLLSRLPSSIASKLLESVSTGGDAAKND